MRNLTALTEQIKGILGFTEVNLNLVGGYIDFVTNSGFQYFCVTEYMTDTEIIECIEQNNHSGSELKVSYEAAIKYGGYFLPVTSSYNSLTQFYNVGGKLGLSYEYFYSDYSDTDNLDFVCSNIDVVLKINSRLNLLSSPQDNAVSLKYDSTEYVVIDTDPVRIINTNSYEEIDSNLPLYNTLLAKLSISQFK